MQNWSQRSWHSTGITTTRDRRDEIYVWFSRQPYCIVFKPSDQVISNCIYHIVTLVWQGTLTAVLFLLVAQASRRSATTVCNIRKRQTCLTCKDGGHGTNYAHSKLVCSGELVETNRWKKAFSIELAFILYIQLNLHEFNISFSEFTELLCEQRKKVFSSADLKMQGKFRNRTHKSYNWITFYAICRTNQILRACGGCATNQNLCNVHAFCNLSKYV